MRERCNDTEGRDVEARWKTCSAVQPRANSEIQKMGEKGGGRWLRGLLGDGED